MEEMTCNETGGVVERNLAVAPLAQRPTLAGHLRILRIDHWVKNVFVLPGIVVALMFDPSLLSFHLLLPICLGILSVCLVSSSNYVINEVLDAPYDKLHPIKHQRPVPSGQVSIPLAYAEWFLVGAAGIGLGLLVSIPFSVTMAILWLMGLIYNVPPLRSKNLPYLDVLSEAFNNPLRMLAGWFMVGPAGIAPASLLVSYWMVGSYFMAIKRFAELRHLDDPSLAAGYRRSFAFYTEPRLLIAITFYGSAAMLFFGAFIMRYRMELILSFPLVAFIMALYFALGFKEDSAAQAPEKLIGEHLLMAMVVLCAVVMMTLLFVDVPILEESFAQTPIRR